MLSFVAGLSMLLRPIEEPPSTSFIMPLEASTIVFKATSTPEWINDLSNDPDLLKLAKCESGLNEKALNPKDTDGLEAKGLFQYKQTTFDAFQKEMGTTTLDIWSGKDQLTLTRWAMSHNKASHWGICL